MIIAAWWLRTSSKFLVRSQRNNRKTRKWTTPKRARICSKCSATVACSWQEDKDGQTNNNNRKSKWYKMLKL